MKTSPGTLNVVLRAPMMLTPSVYNEDRVKRISSGWKIDWSETVQPVQLRTITRVI